jgi:hypothetical protein
MDQRAPDAFFAMLSAVEPNRISTIPKSNNKPDTPSANSLLRGRGA